MPTMMSAWPNRAICSRMAGVKPWAATAKTVPLIAGCRACSPRSALGDRSRRPLRVLVPGDVAAVRGLEGEAAEAERAPRSEPGVDRGADVDPDADQVALDQDGL